MGKQVAARLQKNNMRIKTCVYINKCRNKRHGQPLDRR